MDDRSFNDLVQEVLGRIPAHTPEWTNPRLGDPGRTIIELFAWLTDTLLYRVNLIPERQRLAFLRLLGEHLRPAVPARGLVTVRFADPTGTSVQPIQPLAKIPGPVNFETRSEMTVLPIVGEAWYKRPLTPAEQAAITDLLPGLVSVYGVIGTPRPYASTPLFPAGAPDPRGFDLMTTADGALWIALLAPKDSVLDIRQSLGSQLLSVGYVPSIELPALFEDVGPRGRIPHTWELTTGSVDASRPDFVALDVIADSTQGLRTRGVERLALPRSDFIGAPPNDVRRDRMAGVGRNRPPRIDDPEKAAMLVAWLRLRATVPMDKLALSWAGINAVEIEQLETITSRIVGQSDGSADREMKLPGASVEPGTLVLQVEETGHGFVVWSRVDDLATAGADSRVYVLDSESGLVRFGDGLRGKIPEPQKRVRAALMRSGGGRAGNIPAGSLTAISGVDASGQAVGPTLKVSQTLPTDGGEDVELLAEAERRIPALFRHRDRAVTEDDYKRIARETPAVNLGRVDALPRFKPQQRKTGVPGVVSVMVLPEKSPVGPPNPRPGRPMLEAVHQWLTDRMPIASELYVIGCEYVAIAASVGITLLDGAGRETVTAAVRDALRTFLWPLAGGGPDGEGWRRGRAVRDRELDAVVARVPGVDAINGVTLFIRNSAGRWQMVPRPGGTGAADVLLAIWQLPELEQVTVVIDQDPPTTLDEGGGVAGAGDNTVAIPVVPEVC